MTIQFEKIFGAIRRVFDPDPLPIAAAARRQAESICDKAAEYGRHQDVLADLVHNVRNHRSVPRKKARGRG